MVKRIGVLTSGGDAPGMNAAIRAVTRTALVNGLEVYGIHDGYRGMYDGDIERLYRRSVSDKINRGGTFLGTARLKEFANEEVREEAVDQLRKFGIDALVCIGGDGTYRGALALSKMGIKTVGVPGTIDNDIVGTDYTIGFDTASNTVIELVDKLRDTSSSHRRCSVVEVMGRNCGSIALNAAISVGAEAVICKEVPFDKEALINTINSASKSKRHAIIIVAEHTIDCEALAKEITERTSFEGRATVIGHIQRGGQTSPYDRVLSTKDGVKAMELAMEGNFGKMVAMIDGKVSYTTLEEAVGQMKTVPLDHELLQTAKSLGVYFGD